MNETSVFFLFCRLGASNSSINPILYCYMNKKFRISFMVSYLTVHQNYQFHVWCSRFCFVYSNRISWLGARYDSKTIWQCIRHAAKATTKSTNSIIVPAPCLHAFQLQVAMNSGQKFKSFQLLLLAMHAIEIKIINHAKEHRIIFKWMWQIV